MDEGTRALRALESQMALLQYLHGRIPKLAIGWDRLRTWTGSQLEELKAITVGTGPRTARAAMSARLFWEATMTAKKFAADPEAVQLFMEGVIKDTEDIKKAIDSLSKYLEPGLATEVKREAAEVSAPMAALGQGKEIRRWPFGKELATTAADREFYDSIAAFMNKHAHATPFFILAPREEDGQVWFLACRALEQARILVGILQSVSSGTTSSQS